MSGRGLPGGGLARRHEPEDIQVTLNLRTTLSSTPVRLLKSDQDHPNDTFIQIHVSINQSTSPALPVTLSTWRTPLERSLSREDTSSPVWLNSGLTYLRSIRDPDRYAGPPELGYRTSHRDGFARNLREDWDFLTVPSLESGKEVVIEHRLPVEKLQFWKKRSDGYRDEVEPDEGEKWAIGPSEGGLGTFWWRWGDLVGDLAGKEFWNDEWYDGDKGEERGEREGDGSKWVASEGENGFGLTMQIENQAEVTFV